MHKILSASALLFNTLMMLIFAVGIKAEILEYNGAENGNTSDFIMQKCCAHSIKVTSSEVRSGKFAIISNVLSKDPGVYPHHRAEILLKKHSSLPGKSYWYGWSTLIPDNWVTDPSWVLIAQWHAPSSIVMQPLQLQLSGNKWCWVNWIGVQPAAKYNVLWCENFELEKGKWIDWVVNAKWTNDTSGYIRIWKNGNKVVDRNGPTIYKNYAPNWKVGLVYSASRSITHTIYIDEMRIGDHSSNYEAVAPK